MYFWCAFFLESNWILTAWKVSVFRVMLVRIFRIRAEYVAILRISPYSVRMRNNTDQNNSELEKLENHFSIALPSASYFSGFTLLAPKPFSYDWKIFLIFFKWRRCCWSYQKVKQHPCGKWPSRALWEV